MVAERVLPKDEGGGTRWSDFNFAPSAGRFRRGQAVGLLWETYALAARDGASRYRVAVTLDKVRRSGPAGFAARVIGGAADLVGRTAMGRGRVRLTFDRHVPARPVAVDYLTLDLGAAPPGRYRLTVEVTDLVSSRRASRESAITILE